ncbi:hypothetical protein MJH12_13875 [bacterium]|nr:hypothetical protein [bacterium]
MNTTNQCFYKFEEKQCQDPPDYPYHYCILHNSFAQESTILSALRTALLSKTSNHRGYILNNLVVPKLESFKMKQKHFQDIHIEGSLIDRLFIISSNLNEINCLETNFNHLVLDDLILSQLNIDKINSFRANIVSCDFENSIIQQCHFIEGTINNSSFINIHFKSCVIDNFKITQNQFIDCHFEKCTFMNTTFINNRFEGCQGLENLNLKRCSIDKVTQESINKNCDN